MTPHAPASDSLCCQPGERDKYETPANGNIEYMFSEHPSSSLIIQVNNQLSLLKWYQISTSIHVRAGPQLILLSAIAERRER